MTNDRGVACVRMAAVSTISAMKVERPRDRSSAAPPGLNKPVHHPQPQPPRRHEAPRLRQHRQQRVLAQEGRLPAMFGPVTIASRAQLAPDPSSRQSLGV
jgi:hypothetical protein